ncbi:MAG: efflux RND transporter periplasmic adaptor subunit [Bacteroidales bacterium]|nr:efflux RND transporter periplasmic adaptor subunit [Bacteroidales bacterium]MCF8404674.1 efflux RND transporter periplasmic adaptor subunit [Bacteroidales bacterium]
MKKQLYISIGVIIVIIIALWYFMGGDTKNTETIEVETNLGEFKIAVTTTGELEAKSSEKIYGPSNLRNVRIWQVKIDDIVPDGTVVDSGEFVANLDRTELANKLKDQELEIDQLETQYTKTKLDTSLELRSLRDDLINLEYALEEKKIELEQSKFEPPATIRQVEIELERAGRNYDQSVKNYQLKLEKAEANMEEVTAKLTKAQRKYDEMADVLEEFTVYAPQSGMVIYKRGWDGKKQGIGSQVSTWDNVVATLPDLTKMISKTYVNEIDISKVKVGQVVELGIDAFPEKQFTGEVTEVANIGEQMQNTNAKVFEVLIEVNEFDSVMRPAMTTKNVIITNIIDSALFIPIECVHTKDSISYVVKAGSRYQVIVGKSNENEIIIKEGLKEGDKVFLLPPEGFEEFRLVELESDIIAKHKSENNKKAKKPDDQDSTVVKSHEGKDKKNWDKPSRGGKGGQRKKTQ